MMDDKSMVTFAAYESQGTRLERSNKRLFILNVILIIALIVSNSLWVYYESTFTEEKIVIEADQQADGDSNNYVIGGDYGGESKSQSDKNNEN